MFNVLMKYRIPSGSDLSGKKRLNPTLRLSLIDSRIVKMRCAYLYLNLKLRQEIKKR